MIVDAGSIASPDLCDFRTREARLCGNSQIQNGRHWQKIAQDGEKLVVHNSTMPTKTSSQTLAQWLENALEKAGLNQSELARGVGLTSHKVNRILSGGREMSAEELIRFSSFLNAPIPDLPDAILPRSPYNGEAQKIEEPDEGEFTKEYNRAFAAALQIEREEFDGDMPLDEFITAVTIGLRSQKRAR